MEQNQDSSLWADGDSLHLTFSKSQSTHKLNFTGKQPMVRLVHYTDPICSHCWAAEPKLRKLQIEYGEYFQLEYRMGGLLRNWDGFSDENNSIFKPSDTASHWDEVAKQCGMSMDGDIWHEDPVLSSFPPSIAFYAAQAQSPDHAVRFLRILREKLYLHKKNITRQEYLVEAAAEVGLDIEKFLSDYHSEEAKKTFELDMELGSGIGILGFPTFVFIDLNGVAIKVTGNQPYERYVQTLEKLSGESLKKNSKKWTILELFDFFPCLSTREVAMILDQADHQTTEELVNLLTENQVVLEKQKYGDFWRKASSES